MDHNAEMSNLLSRLLANVCKQLSSVAYTCLGGVGKELHCPCWVGVDLHFLRMVLWCLTLSLMTGTNCVVVWYFFC